MHLYQITEQYLELQHLADNPDEPLTHDMVADTLEAIEAGFEEKAKSVAVVINSIEANVGVIEKEIKRLKARAEAAKNASASLRSYLKQNMQGMKLTNIKDDLFTITLAKGRYSVIVDDVEKLSDDFVSVKPAERVPDKKALLKALSSQEEGDEEIEGAHLERGESSIRIK